ncbi:hypothetical protein HMPREF9413_5725, partial [Paenibacillus sp. HGF7]
MAARTTASTLELQAAQDPEEFGASRREPVASDSGGDQP